MLFDLTADQRRQLFSGLLPQLEDYYARTRELRVAPELDPEKIRGIVARFDFSEPLEAGAAVDVVISNLLAGQVHVPHPRYFGLYNPRTNFPSILADLIAAYFNPQLAAWSHSPFAVEVENHLLRAYGKKFGYDEGSMDGTFTSGGAEANLTGVLCALHHRFPEYAERGYRAFGGGELVVYCSDEAHHSVVKAARVAGLAALCQQFGVWLHVDAAFGGAAVLNDRYRDWLRGIEVADSITTDIHKWLSVPMGTGLFLTRHPDILDKTFRTTAAYMPREGEELAPVNPYSHTLQWSRRFLGLRMYLSLLVFGWEGYAETIRHHVELGDYLRGRLTEAGWTIENDTPLPVVCFSRPGTDALAVCGRVVASGQAWLSVYPIHGVDVLRAGITNYATTRADIDRLVELLG